MTVRPTTVVSRDNFQLKSETIVHETWSFLPSSVFLFSSLPLPHAGLNPCWHKSKLTERLSHLLFLTKSTSMTSELSSTNLQHTPSTGPYGACTRVSHPSIIRSRIPRCLESELKWKQLLINLRWFFMIVCLCFRSPSVMGILVADRRFLGEIGVLDEGMKVYGGENVELGIRVSKRHLATQWWMIASSERSKTLAWRVLSSQTHWKFKFPSFRQILKHRKV